MKDVSNQIVGYSTKMNLSALGSNFIETLNFRNDNLGQKPRHNSYGIVSTDLDGFPKVNVFNSNT